jgi:hypothetical protein
LSALRRPSNIDNERSQVAFVPRAGNVRAQQFDAIPTAVGADQEADLIIFQRIADVFASEIQIA